MAEDHTKKDPEAEERIRKAFEGLPRYNDFAEDMMRYRGPVEDDDTVAAMRYAMRFGMTHSLKPDAALTPVQEAEARLVPRICGKGRLQLGVCHEDMELVAHSGYFQLKCPSHGFLHWDWTLPKQ